jgi:hypothetical protein
MEDLDREYRGRGVQSVFLYVREAHPGEVYAEHDSFERKLAHAREFRRWFGVERQILVDDVAGTAHRAFGTLPNMTYVISSSNTVVFRSAWTDPPTVRAALDYLLAAADRRRGGARLAPFYSELMGFRWVDDPAFFEGLRRNGPRAEAEFRAAREQWRREGRPVPRARPT